MIYPENRRLFTVSELARACGSSRASLIRMEEDGFLTPYRVDPETGYRYYDADNAAQVGQYQMLQSLGLTRREIADYYYGRIDRAAFLAGQRQKFDRMQRRLEELVIRQVRAREPFFSFVDLPELYCWCVTMTISSVEESATLTYDAYGKCIEEGYRILGTEPLFALRADGGRPSADGAPAPYELTSCIPVEPPARPDPRLRRFPAARAFSGLASGSYATIPALYQSFWREVEARRLQLTGPVRMIALVAPYVGKHISPEDFCYRVVAPATARGD